MKEFERIYNEYSMRVYCFMYKLCGDKTEAEELTQETFYRALKNFNKFRGDSAVFTWLAAIAKKTYYSYIKKKKHGLDSIDINAVVDTYCLFEESAEDTVLRSHVQQIVKELVHELPDKYRDVVMLRIYADMTFAQIAQTMGITENSAKVIYYRAKIMLKERLEK